MIMYVGCWCDFYYFIDLVMLFLGFDFKCSFEEIEIFVYVYVVVGVKMVGYVVNKLFDLLGLMYIIGICDFCWVGCWLCEFY